MFDLQTLTDHVEISALVSEFTDAGMMRDYDRWASLFTVDAHWQIAPGALEFTGREAIRAGMERLQGNWEFFVQQVHPGWISIDGDTATGRAYTEELGRFTDGTSHANYAIYHDTFRRTPDGWKFTERVYEFRYRDDSTLPGTAAPRP